MVDPVSASLIAGAGAWAWKSYGKDMVSKVFGKATGATHQWLVEARWDSAAEAYREEICYQCETFRILGKPQPVLVKSIFADVYVLDKLTAQRRFSVNIFEKHSPDHLERHKDPTRHNGLELINQPGNERLFILGKPGSGKTTFLKFITLQAAEGKIDKVPIFISLNDWSHSKMDLMDYLVERFDICQFPNAQPFIERLLKTGRAIVLFDGLDEVKREHGLRSNIIKQIKKFSQKYRASQYLITCRIAASEYRFDKYQDVEIADFTKNQINTFVDKWFRDSPVKRGVFFREFYNKGNERLQELASTPLLLSLLCLAFEETMTFPRRRSDLYTEAINALLGKWDELHDIQRDIIYKNLSLMLKQQMFARIAFESFGGDARFFRQSNLEKRIVSYLKASPAVDAKDQIDGRQILKAIEAHHGIIIERGKRAYSFAHLTFQEYFTAKFIADHARQGAAKHLIDSYLTDDRWREVFFLTASLLNRGDYFFALFKKRVDSLIVGDKKLTKMLAWVKQKTAEGNDTLNKPAAVRSWCFASALDLASTFTRTIAFSRNKRDFEVAHDTARAIALGLDLDLNFNLDHANNYVRPLAMALHRDLGSRQVKQLKAYLAANQLLVECLNLASVSNRTAIENSLLLPPGQAAGR